MLRALENHLAAPIASALPASVQLITGPSYPPVDQSVVVHASYLDIEPYPDTTADAAASPTTESAYHIELISWPGDGAIADFAIPATHTGALLDVESPPGFPAVPRDDYFLEDRVIRFYRPPEAAPEAVRARLRGDDARGWHRRRRATMTLTIAAWARDNDDSDGHCQLALHIALTQLVALPILKPPALPGLSVNTRALPVRTVLHSFERFADPGTGLVCAKATIQTLVELDLVVAHGAPALQGVIEQIAHDVATE